MSKGTKVARYRQRQKLKVVEALGGKCSICGYNKCVWALEVHHIDPSIKKFGIAFGGITKSWLRIAEEIQNCRLLCANCHREEHCFLRSIA